MAISNTSSNQNNIPGAPTTPMLIPKKSQEAMVAFNRETLLSGVIQSNLRENLREIDLQYIREKDLTTENARAKVANKYGDSTKYQNITFPVVMPAVEQALAFQADVFLTGTPMFPVEADPAYINEALQLSSIIDSQAVRGGWARELMKVIRDGLKYNLAALELDWCVEKVASYDTDPVTTRASQKELYWSGNRLRHRDLYNTFWDHRYNVTEVPTHGEFVGYTELMSRIHLKQFINSLPEKLVDNVRAAFESGIGASAGGNYNDSSVSRYYLPDINPSALLDRKPGIQSTNWLAWAGLVKENQGSRQIDYKNIYEVTTLYGRIIPNDFALNVPAKNTPQIWKMIFVNGTVLIYAERLTNAHDMFPILFAQPLEDGLKYQTKSFAANVQPFQELNTALVNSLIAARRRAISDRELYDPSLVSLSDINSDNPSAKIPVRPRAYGKTLADAIYPIPFRDEQSQYIMQEMPFFISLADRITGQNPARQGQFVKGNKSRKEFEETMANATNPDQMMSILLESQLFTPIKEIAKSNILQYQQSGDVYSRAQKKNVTIDPIALRKAMMEFKVADGSTPSSKVMNVDVWQTAVQQALSSPNLGAGMNMAPMFSYLMKIQGADVSPFEKSPPQMAYEQALNAWSMAAQEASKAGAKFDVPQPQPQQYGYIPGQPVEQQGVQPSGAPTA